jgi:hypothetical protein
VVIGISNKPNDCRTPKKIQSTIDPARQEISGELGSFGKEKDIFLFGTKIAANFDLTGYIYLYRH